MNVSVAYQNNEGEFEVKRNYIPNINSVATLFDRLTVENVKLSFFLELEKTPGYAMDTEVLNERISNQKIIKDAVEDELRLTLITIFDNGSYEPLYEERTFK